MTLMIKDIAAVGKYVFISTYESEEVLRGFLMSIGRRKVDKVFKFKDKRAMICCHSEKSADHLAAFLKEAR